MKKKIAFLFLTLLLAGSVSSCGSDSKEPDQTPAPEQASLKLSVAEYPKVDGSTATIPLSEAVATAVLDMSIEEARQYIVHNKTHEAYVNLIDGNADIIFVTSPSKEELAYAKGKGVTLNVVPVVSEGFVFLTNRNNPVSDLSLQQVKDIYAGKITNWKEVGGEDRKIIAYQRPQNSGSQTGMLDLVLGPEEIMDAPVEQIIGEMGALIDAVAVYTNEEDAIGYSYFYYATDMWSNDEVKLLAIDGVPPDKETIRDGSYPIQTAYYAVLRNDEPEDSNASKLLKWILSNQGQQIAEEAGYVKLGT
ncbi:PstS family phosphate ABC transporter substrate-binding protein [Sinanaerobacter chloroacetimidivorans]|uniref:Substrate-binding domain-containing protein n=1 Tax=Sinanaerobacter chloroacetimidivorans TaxID=2818044 RepID=A0A8J8B2M4_9FIRM|nr:substrate-binding domain-containing protein [Sinanaerobacter chloroacetimidivorans]MBR0598882.1 substrate-binding domain-containing protein [Sinanaerobacter chloroacetimidivorans]